MSELDNAERVREYYRKQGEKREQERILELLAGLTYTETDQWNSDDDVWLKDKWISIVALIRKGTK